jgi:hydrogenase/urease accessory protein HupE
MLMSQVSADEARPVYVEIEQVSTFKYSVRWKIPPVMAEGEEPRISLEHASCNLAMDKSPDLKFDIRLIYPVGNPALTSLVVFNRLFSDPQQIFSGPEVTTITLGALDEPLDVSKQYLSAGIEHILVGSDHLLFIVCLIVIARSFRRLVLTVTGFTVAHSITLSLATLNIVQVRTELVELLIALSILLLAVEIIKHYRIKDYTSFTWRYPVTVSSVFGLLHGFGFAVVLQELGLPQSMKIHALLFFNIGVEIGQLLFIAAVVVVSLLAIKLNPAVDRSQIMITQLSIYVIGSCSAYWLFERTILLL